MPDKRIYIVKNIGNKPCKVCEGKHEYLSRESQHARCGTPAGFPKDIAIQAANTLGFDPDEAVMLAPDNIVVVLEPRARKLKQQSGQAVPLEQIPMQPRPM